MRASVAALLLLLPLFAAGCGSVAGRSSGDEGEGAPPPAGSLAAILEASAPDVVLTPGTEDYARGAIRVSFLVLDRRARPALRPTARVLVAAGLRQKPFLQATAHLETIGVSGE